MIRSLGHDVVCDLCGSITHCSEDEPWPHKNIDVKQRHHTDTVGFEVCKECWPDPKPEIKKTMIRKFLEKIGVKI